MNVVKSFFDRNYKTPLWFKEKRLKEKRFKEKLLKEKLFKEKGYKETQFREKHTSINTNRRNALKSAGGMVALAALPRSAFSKEQSLRFKNIIKTEPWLTLEAVLNHLLPESPTGPSAKDIQATAYLYNVMYEQPTEKDEKDFIVKGVGWLNGYSNKQLEKAFVYLSFDEKETILRGISGSQAGENWLSTLVSYIFEAMLTPPVYGGNPDGIGWKWLDHKAGFPLPKAGNRYYELPGQQSANQNSNQKNVIASFLQHKSKEQALAKGKKA